MTSALRSRRCSNDSISIPLEPLRRFECRANWDMTNLRLNPAKR
jgi:hypothetical protein